MNIFLGYESALKYWQMADLDPRHAPSRLRPEVGQTPSSADIAASAALDFAGDDGRVQVVVARDSDRRHGSRMHCRVYDASTDRNAFLKIADGLYVATPEMLFFQMAGVLPIVDLIELGFTLTSGYAEDENAPDGMRKRSPLTSVSALRRYALNKQGTKGYKKAACALLYICDNSASPMETLLARAAVGHRVRQLIAPHRQPCDRAEPEWNHRWGCLSTLAAAESGARKCLVANCGSVRIPSSGTTFRPRSGLIMRFRTIG